MVKFQAMIRINYKRSMVISDDFKPFIDKLPGEIVEGRMAMPGWLKVEHIHKISPYTKMTDALYLPTQLPIHPKPFESTQYILMPFSVGLTVVIKAKNNTRAIIREVNDDDTLTLECERNKVQCALSMCPK